MPGLPTIPEGKRKVIYIIWYNVNLLRGSWFGLSKVETAYPRGGKPRPPAGASASPEIYFLFFYFYFL